MTRRGRPFKAGKRRTALTLPPETQQRLVDLIEIHGIYAQQVVAQAIDEKWERDTRTFRQRVEALENKEQR